MASQPLQTNQWTVTEPLTSIHALIDQSPGTAASGHVANSQTWSNAAQFHIQNTPSLYYPPSGAPTLHPLLPTRLWKAGNG